VPSTQAHIHKNRFSVEECCRRSQSFKFEIHNFSVHLFLWVFEEQSNSAVEFSPPVLSYFERRLGHCPHRLGKRLVKYKDSLAVSNGFWSLVAESGH
jgi:hypothetical protein